MRYAPIMSILWACARMFAHALTHVPAAGPGAVVASLNCCCTPSVSVVQHQHSLVWFGNGSAATEETAATGSAGSGPCRYPGRARHLAVGSAEETETNAGPAANRIPRGRRDGIERRRAEPRDEATCQRRGVLSVPQPPASSASTVRTVRGPPRCDCR